VRFQCSPASQCISALSNATRRSDQVCSVAICVDVTLFSPFASIASTNASVCGASPSSALSTNNDEEQENEDDYHEDACAADEVEGEVDDGGAGVPSVERV
jgi:hypothetical protein